MWFFCEIPFFFTFARSIRGGFVWFDFCFVLLVFDLFIILFCYVRCVSNFRLFVTWKNIFRFFFYLKFLFELYDVRWCYCCTCFCRSRWNAPFDRAWALCIGVVLMFYTLVVVVLVCFQRRRSVFECLASFGLRCVLLLNGECKHSTVAHDVFGCRRW